MVLFLSVLLIPLILEESWLIFVSPLPFDLSSMQGATRSFVTPIGIALRVKEGRKPPHLVKESAVWQ